MEKKFITINTKVIDTWYKDYGIGTIIDVKKTVFTVLFGNKKIIYDYPHSKFLEKV